MDDHLELIGGIFTALIGVAIVAVIFSKKSQTGSVIGAAGNAFGGILAVAVSPITGQNYAGTGGQNFGGFTGGGGTPTVSSVSFDPTQFVNSVSGLATTVSTLPSIFGGQNNTPPVQQI